MGEFERALVELLPRMRRFARALTGKVEDADDLVQIALERALSRRDQWARGTRLDSWAFTIMKNAWLDEARSRTRRSRLFASPEQVDDVADPRSPTLEARLEKKAIEAAMEKLSPEHRLALVLVLVEGFSYADAAAVLDVPIGTLTSRLVRARQALMADLSGGTGGPH